MTADTIRSYVRTNLFTDDELQLDEASYSNMHNLAKHSPPPSRKGESFDTANWKLRNK